MACKPGHREVEVRMSDAARAELDERLNAMVDKVVGGLLPAHDLAPLRDVARRELWEALKLGMSIGVTMAVDQLAKKVVH